MLGGAVRALDRRQDHSGPARTNAMDKLREAVEHLLNTCPPIDASGEEAHARARAALAEPVADEPVYGRWCLQPDRCQWQAGGAGCRSCDETRSKGVPMPAAAPAERGEYPPLPEPFIDLLSEEGLEAWANQMRAYVDADRAQRVPLTEAEIMDVFQAARNAKLGAGQDNSAHRLSVVEIARAVERAHGMGVKP